VYTGLRSGEKLFEELFHAHENYQSTSHAKIFLAQPRSMSWEILNAQLQKAGLAVREFDEDVLRRTLVSLLPEWREEQAEVVPLTRTQNERNH
jgi:FlaA1/EpsC-like NDP-sugar epimerase